MTQQNLVLKSW